MYYTYRCVLCRTERRDVMSMGAVVVCLAVVTARVVLCTVRGVRVRVSKRDVKLDDPWTLNSRISLTRSIKAVLNALL